MNRKPIWQTSRSGSVQAKLQFKTEAQSPSLQRKSAIVWYKTGQRVCRLSLYEAGSLKHHVSPQVRTRKGCRMKVVLEVTFLSLVSHLQVSVNWRKGRKRY